MDPDDRIAALFASLTSHLEDAAALAAEGQQAGKAAEERLTLAREIGAHLRTAQASLTGILQQLSS